MSINRDAKTLVNMYIVLKRYSYLELKWPMMITLIVLNQVENTKRCMHNIVLHSFFFFIYVPPFFTSFYKTFRYNHFLLIFPFSLYYYSRNAISQQ